MDELLGDNAKLNLGGEQREVTILFTDIRGFTSMSENKFNELKSVIGNKYVLTHKWQKQPFINGWRYGNGDAIAVLKPGNLLQLWKLIEICVPNDFIIIMPESFKSENSDAYIKLLDGEFSRVTNFASISQNNLDSEPKMFQPEDHH